MIDPVFQSYYLSKSGHQFLINIVLGKVVKSLNTVFVTPKCHEFVRLPHTNITQQNPPIMPKIGLHIVAHRVGVANYIRSGNIGHEL